ncbi:MAG: hypothetical protein K0S41_3248 [Anaerocolumna sp.]|jgi:hypothetical protein|nr:hypothetical protein [Anaerocolumna sp.]
MDWFLFVCYNMVINSEKILYKISGINLMRGVIKFYNITC